jgi:opacity protein-like surface antigen
MNFNEQILDFLDGESSLEQDRALFEQAIKNPEIITKLKKMMVIEDSLNHNSEFFEPPLTTSNKVFENLGFSYKNKSTLAGFWSFFTGSKVITAAISSVVTIILLSSIYIYFNNQQSESDANLITQISESNIPIVNQEKVYNKTLGNDFGNISTKNSTEPKIITKYITKNEYVTTDKNGNLISFDSEQDLIEYFNESNANMPYTELVNNNLSNNTKSIKNSRVGENNQKLVSNFSPFINELPNPIFNSYLLNSRDYLDGLEIFLISPFSNNPNGVSQNSTNFRLSYLPIKSNNWEFGAILSRENFMQNFENQIDDFRTLNYSQNPALLNFGIAGRYNYQINESFSPYIQIGSGASISNGFNLYPGFYYRASLGTKLDLNFLPFDLNIGLQNTSLNTFIYGGINNSNNTSIIFGVSL